MGGKCSQGFLKNQNFRVGVSAPRAPIGRGWPYSAGQTDSQPQKPTWSRFRDHFRVSAKKFRSSQVSTKKCSGSPKVEGHFMPILVIWQENSGVLTFPPKNLQGLPGLKLISSAFSLFSKKIQEFTSSHKKSSGSPKVEAPKHRFCETMFPALSMVGFAPSGSY